jgi:histidine ammonia-lyase
MVELNGHQLEIRDIWTVALGKDEVCVSADAVRRMEESRGWVDKISNGDVPVYGINTGFGIFADKKISREDTSRLTRNLILSHSVGMGEPLPREVVRAAMLVRANTLVKGFSGVRPVIVQTLIDMLNKGVTPVVPSQGSMGSSGDLGPLSHLALVLTTDEKDLESDSGFAEYKGQTMSGKAAMATAGIPRVILGPKEGLAMNNGATFSAAIGAYTAYEASRLYHAANAALAMSLEALQGLPTAFDERIHDSRGQIGQIETAAEIRDYIAGSTLIGSVARVQDAYSLRCAPQVHGASRDAIAHTSQILTREVNAATDNPLLFGEGIALSGGNFHGEPVGMVLDYLTIALAEIGAISERRVFRLTDGNLNAGLPSMLVDGPKSAGLNSGLMMCQYTAASLVLESQTLAMSDTVHSLPTSGGQEDHNANSMTAARHAYQVLQNSWKIVAIELFTAARGLDLRLRALPECHSSPVIANILQQIRSLLPYHADDRLWGADVETLLQAVLTGRIRLPNLEA